MKLAALHGLPDGKSEFETLLPLGDVGEARLSFKEMLLSGGVFKGKKYQSIYLIDTAGTVKRKRFSSVQESENEDVETELSEEVKPKKGKK